MIYQPHNAPLEQIGGKAAALARLADLPIPPWFVVIGDDLTDLQTHLGKLNSTHFAVRSSARSEDGKEHSFAGLYDSYLCVPREQVAEKIKAVQAAAHHPQLITYRAAHGIDDDSPPAVIVQKMLAPTASGVAFSADPISGRRDTAIVSSVWGIGSALVSGIADSDQWQITDKITHTEIAEKTIQHSPSPEHPEGVKETTPQHPNKPSLTEPQILQVAALARKCAQAANTPQDIEWAIENGELYLLQSRPITTLHQLPDPTDPLTIWDNSNIAESYPGITSPLTFTFASRIYEHVYREFCTLLSVPKSRIEQHDQVFPKMLGSIQGRIYYNLISWYHVLAMLPGFNVNRSFMEQMMGVKTPMPEEIVQEIAAQHTVSKFSDTIALLKTLKGLWKSNRRLPRQIDQFYTRLNQVLTDSNKSLETMTGTQLADHYQDLEAKLLKKWDAPLVNDFFAMIYVGILKSLCTKWLNEPGLENLLLQDSGEIISAEPPKRIAEMATHVPPELAKILTNPEPPTQQKLHHLNQNPTLKTLYNNYLEKWGDRCLAELKLESPTVGAEPESLLTSIGAMASRPKSTSSPTPEKTKIPKLPFIKKQIFHHVLKNARERVKNRENLRFERTRLFGRVRRIVTEIGKRLHADQLIENPQDIFHLELQEILGTYQGTTDPKTFQALINARKTQTQLYNEAPEPPDRIQTRGPIHRHHHWEQEEEIDPSETDLTGTGACAGIVKGTVRVITDPRGAQLQQDEILVAQQTDPGWVVLFPAASGILVERGSLLSHSAIVARELQIPCVVSLKNITKILKTGDQVEMNGKTGTVKIVNDEN